MNAYDFQLKIVVLGNSGAGKTSILLRYVKDSFKTRAKPTIPIDTMISYLQIDQKNVKLQIWDTAG
jgi:small GTP-binding protein